MTVPRPEQPEPRDVDAEFARMLESEGLQVRPGQAPREPAAEEPGFPLDGYPASPDSPPEPPSEQSRARARAAHPSAGGIGPSGADGVRGAAGPRDFDDDEVLYGDFMPPDPDLPEPSSGTLWSWTALIGGFVLLMLATFSVHVPGAFGWLGGAVALGGVISLLLRAPRERREDGDGAQV